MSAPQTNLRPAPDPVLVEIVDYVLGFEIDSELALETLDVGSRGGDLSALRLGVGVVALF